MFNLSDIPITSITNLSFAMETDAGASGIYGYSYIYNVSKAEWYQIGYGDMASASDVWLNGDLLSSQHISDFFDGNFTYFLVTESYNNGLTWTLDYVTVKLSYNTAAPAPGLATGNNTNFSTSIRVSAGILKNPFFRLWPQKHLLIWPFQLFSFQTRVPSFLFQP